MQQSSLAFLCGGSVRILLACVASVSVLFRSKQRPRNRILGFGCARMLRGQFDSRNSTETLATQAMMSGTLSPLGQMFGGKHRHRDVRTGVYHQMEQLFTNRKFHFCSHQNFRVFFLNGKRPKTQGKSSLFLFLAKNGI